MAIFRGETRLLRLGTVHFRNNSLAIYWGLGKAIGPALAATVETDNRDRPLLVVRDSCSFCVTPLPPTEPHKDVLHRPIHSTSGLINKAWLELNANESLWRPFLSTVDPLSSLGEARVRELSSFFSSKQVRWKPYQGCFEQIGARGRFDETIQRAPLLTIFVSLVMYNLRVGNMRRRLLCPNYSGIYP